MTAMRPGVYICTVGEDGKARLQLVVLTMFSCKKLLVRAAVRPSHLVVMLSPLLPHQSQAVAAVYPPPAQYNDLRGYSIPPPHFTIPQASMAIQAHRQPEHVMKAIIVHRFVQHPYSLSSTIS